MNSTLTALPPLTLAQAGRPNLALDSLPHDHAAGVEKRMPAMAARFSMLSSYRWSSAR
jgi:hypothetical protein